ncbi:MAG: tetratricopeptide repeat protein [Pseudomonadota bacterium]|nr:tetratricopeptide repeat protein [Pseudomonadota bacterium]
MATSATAAAQETVITRIDGYAQDGIGHQYRKDVDAANRAMLNGQNLEGAAELLAPVLRYCDQQRQEPGRIAISVASAAEYEHYIAGHGNGVPVDWIDMACPMAYKAMAFMHGERKAYDVALPYLDTAIAMAPYWPEALIERGFVLNQLGRTLEGLASYRGALELTESFKSVSRLRAMALRGTGYSLIELGDFEGAQTVYEKSLEIEPDNKTATGELEYIRKQLEKRNDP